MKYTIEERAKRHQEIMNGLNELYVSKNKEYGDSFHNLYKDLGIISAVTQITHKYNRLKKLAKDYAVLQDKAEVENESLTDTLLDLANYCVLTVMEIEREQNESEE